MTTKRVAKAVPIPKIKGFPILGSAIDVKFGAGFHTAFDKWRNIYGDVFDFNIGKLQFTIVGDADLAEHILSKHKDADNFKKKAIYDNSLGEHFAPNHDVQKHGQLGLISADTDRPAWKYSRKITEEGVMKAKVIEKSLSVIESVGRELVENIRRSDQSEDSKENTIIVSDVSNLMNKTALDVISTITFGECFNSLKGEDHLIARNDRILFQSLIKIAADPIKLWKWAPKAFHPSYWTNCVQAITENKAYVAEIIEKSKKDLSAGKEPDCILENFLANGAEEILNADDPFQFTFIMRQIVLAGHDSTSNTLSFLLWELAKNPEIQEEIREEILHLNDDPENSGLDAYKKAIKLNNCIKETLRLWCPVIFTLPRCGEQESISDDYIIPAKTSVAICPWLLHRNPKYWDDPATWNPERFTETRRGAHRYSYLPFSAGARNCAGQRLAMTEMRILMSHLLINFRISLTDQTPAPESQFVILKCTNLKLRFDAL